MELLKGAVNYKRLRNTELEGMREHSKFLSEVRGRAPQALARSMFIKSKV